MGKMDEMILVAKRSIVFENETLTFQGTETVQERVDRISKNVGENIEVMRRGDAEENQEFKQPIPYVILRRGNEIFTYKRLSGGGEARLFDKLSIGAGGHMNAVEGLGFLETVSLNTQRELEEELNIVASTQKLTPVGLINDDELEKTNGNLNERTAEGGIPVGRVHIGLLIVNDLPLDAEVTVRETDQLLGEWMSVEKLKSEGVFEKLESWSQIAVNTLSK